MNTPTVLWVLLTPPLLLAVFLLGFYRGLGSIQVFTSKQHTVRRSWFHSDRTVTDHTAALAGGRLIYGSLEFKVNSTDELSELLHTASRLIGMTTGQQLLSTVFIWARALLGFKETDCS
jgi:hypothetical protein